jgi:uncharacterized protein with von Willebrand factor type A (vWA) domain
MDNPAPAQPAGHITANLLIFARLLRSQGLKISTHQIQGLAEAMLTIDLSERAVFYHTARVFLVLQRAHQELFDKAFELYWLNRSSWQLKLAFSEDTQSRIQSPKDPPSDQDLNQTRNNYPLPDQTDGEQEPASLAEPSSSSTYSPLEILRQKDFTDFTDDDIASARRLLQEIQGLPAERLSRRRVRKTRRAYQLDLPGSVRRSLKQGGELIEIAWLTRKSKPRPLVILCDISGSMARYSRIFLHFMFTLVQRTNRMETFVFGTRLTRVTRAMHLRDIDTALTKTAEIVSDWGGGTRIGQSLREFNYRWSRRVLRHGAVVIIISDGWDRGETQLLENQIQRLRRHTRHLIWLNPLLGSPDYQPLVQGIRTVLPYIDDFLPIHNLASFKKLADRLRNIR